MDISKYFERISKYIEKINLSEIVNAGKILKETIDNEKTIYIAGNGGSMATAMHFAEDLMLQNKLKTKVYSLSSSPCLTAIGNDYNFDNIFKKQLEHTMEQGDVLVVISASGSSENLITAVNYANKFGETIGIVGFDGGKLKTDCSCPIFIPTTLKDYEATEDIHSMICHILEYIVKEGNEIAHID